MLVLPYGSAFPLEAWPAIRDFVKHGGGLVVLGGAPFHQPVRQEKGRLRPRPPPADLRARAPDRPVRRARRGGVRGPAEGGGGARTASGTGRCRSRRGRGRFTCASRPAPMRRSGAAPPGRRDGVLRPLVHLVDAKGVARLCPLLEIDRLRGTEAGARWVLAPSDARLDAATIRKAVERALEGAVELDARPVRAAVEPGEAPILRRHPAPAGAARRRDRAVARAGGGPQRRRGRGVRRRRRARRAPRDAGRPPDAPLGGRASARPLPGRGLDAPTHPGTRGR